MRLAVVFGSYLALTTLLISSNAIAQGNERPSPVQSQMARLAGTWRLIATRQRMTDGTIRSDPDLGSKPSGYLMLDATAGQMCTVTNNGDRAKWVDAAHPTDVEARAIWTQTVSYCGSWTVDSTHNELVYRLGANMSPNVIGAERRRRFTLDGDRLVLYPTPLPAGVTQWEVEWRKSSTAGAACDTDPVRKRVCAIDDSLGLALIRGDTSALGRIYADDLSSINYRGMRSTKVMLLDAIAARRLRFDTLKVLQRGVDVRGDTAVVAERMHQVAMGSEGIHPAEVNYHRTYVRHGSQWQFVAAVITPESP